MWERISVGSFSISSDSSFSVSAISDIFINVQLAVSKREKLEIKLQYKEKRKEKETVYTN